MASKKKAPIDWESIEREYRAGQLSNAEIARGHGVTPQAITMRAKRSGWVKDLSGQVRERVRAELVNSSVKAPHASAPEIVEAAAARGVDVVRSHRRDISALRGVAQELTRRLQMSLGIIPMEEGVNPRMAFGEKESPADVAEKLSRTLHRLVPLERQAFSLDEPGAGNPAGGTFTPEQVKRMAREVVEDGG